MPEGVNQTGCQGKTINVEEAVKQRQSGGGLFIYSDKQNSEKKKRKTGEIMLNGDLIWPSNYSFFSGLN